MCIKVSTLLALEISIIDEQEVSRGAVILRINRLADPEGLGVLTAHEAFLLVILKIPTDLPFGGPPPPTLKNSCVRPWDMNNRPLSPKCGNNNDVSQWNANKHGGRIDVCCLSMRDSPRWI